MKPFEEWTYEDATKAINAHVAEHVGDAYDVNRAMVEDHDLWQRGELWVGPRGSDQVWVAKIRDSVERQYVPGGAVLEAFGNVVRGLLGKEATLQLVPREEVPEGSEQAEALEREAKEVAGQLMGLWGRVQLWRHMRRVVIRSRWAGWGPIRWRIPPGRLERSEGEDGTVVTRLPRFESFEDALSAIDLSTPEPKHCVVIEHEDTQQRAAIFHYTAQDSKTGDRSRVELWYEDGDQTVSRVLVEGGETLASETYDWGGRLPITEVDGELLLTEPVRRAEASLAFAQTNVNRSTETSGFRERYTMNAEPAGLWLPVRPNDIAAPRSSTDEHGNTLYFHPLPRSLGAGVTTDLIGVLTESTPEGEKRATPGVEIADPVDPEHAIKAARFWRARVLEMCYQGHLAMTGKGETSGEAYEQARAAYIGDLDAHVDPTERALTEAIEAVIVMAESMMSAPPRYLERYRVVVTVVPDPGPVSAAVRQEIRADVEAGLLSRVTAMAKAGVDDVDDELDAIEQDPKSQLGLIHERVGIMRELRATEPDMPLVQAARVAGWSEEEAKELFGETDTLSTQDRQERDAIRDALEGGGSDDEDVD